MKLLIKYSPGKCICLIICFCFLLNNGCVQQQIHPTKSVTIDERDVFDYYRWLKTSPEIVIEREKEYLKQQPEILDPVISMTRLAMLLTLTARTTSRDEKDALKILEKVTKQTNTDSSPIHREYWQFSILLQDIIIQRQKMRFSINESNKDISENKKVIKSLQEENAELMKQIEALKSIEQQINKREQKHDNAP